MVEDKEIIIRINKCKILIQEIKEGVVVTEIVIIAANQDTCRKNVQTQDNQDQWEEAEEEMMVAETHIRSMMMKRERGMEEINHTTGEEINHQIHQDLDGENQRVYQNHQVLEEDGEELLITPIQLKTQEAGETKLLAELLIITFPMAGETPVTMTTGEMVEVIMKTDHHQQDHKDQKMTEVEEEDVVAAEEAEEMDHQTEEEVALNAIKKVTWLENVQILIKDPEEEEEAVEETASNAIKKVIWQEIVQMLTNNHKEVEETEETEEEAEVEVEEDQVVVATNATKMVTSLKIAQMNQTKMIQDHTRDKEEMMEVL